MRHKKFTPPKECRICGELFYKRVTKSVAMWENQIYCSRSCAAKGTDTFYTDPLGKVISLFSRTINTESGCMEWEGAHGKQGYGQASIAGMPWVAHRVVYHYLVEPIPDGLLVCHECDNPKCINPEHLFVGTHKDNRQDCVLKGRTNRRLIKDNIRIAIATMVSKKVHGHVIAEIFGVSQAGVSKIAREQGVYIGRGYYKRNMMEF